MSLRNAVFVLSMMLGCVGAHAQSQATIQSQINSACSTGGTVLLPSSITFTSTLTLTCPVSTTKPVTLQGAPTVITCSTGAAPCITIGATTTGTNVYRSDLMLSGVNLTGPGFAQVGSVGVRLLNSAYMAHLSHVRIEGFERGLHIQAPDYLLPLINIEDFTSGVPSISTKIAVHLEGMVANAHFVNFGLSGRERVLLMDGPGGSGGGASFTSGYFNSTLTPGIAGIAVSNTDASIKQLNISNVEDWETACPYLELGAGAWATLTGIGWTGDPRPSDNNPAIHILSGGNAWLKIAASTINPCSAGTDLIKNDSATSMILVSSSDLYLGKINFTAAGQGAFVGNRCTTADASSSFTGMLTKVKSQGNVGTCEAR